MNSTGQSAVADAPILEPGTATASVSIWRRVRHDVILLGAGNTGVVLAQIGFRGILIAALAPSAYGRLALILSLYNTITIISASGLPNSAARYLSAGSPSDDRAIVRSAARAGLWPTLIAAALTAIASAMLLGSAVAAVFAVLGLSSLVYSLLTTGILRGRGKVALAASIMPVAAFSEVAILGGAWAGGLSITPVSAFSVFCFGNVVGLLIGATLVFRTRPRWVSSAHRALSGHIPTAREFLTFSLWLSVATTAIAAMPLVMRFAATLDSFTVVAIVDITLVFLSIPQRVGTVIVSAVVPHATRAIGEKSSYLTISRREHLIMIVPFALVAVLVAATPLIGWLFDVIGRPQYGTSADYLALALLASPARILYGLVEGVLVAHGESRFLAFNALATTTLASGVIFAVTALGDTTLAFAVFALAAWTIYLVGIVRIRQLERRAESEGEAGRPR
jgi:O-antigen/teichoic acid export membrane protein